MDHPEDSDSYLGMAYHGSEKRPVSMSAEYSCSARTLHDAQMPVTRIRDVT